MKPWQHGYELAFLRQISARFREHDGKRTLGAFSAVKENTVANWLHNGHLYLSAEAAVVLKISKTATTVSDFRGETICSMPAGSVIVERAAGSAQGIVDLISENSPASAPMIWRNWAGHNVDDFAARALNLARCGTTIRASSEVIAVWQRGASALGSPVSQADEAGIIPLVSTRFPTQIEAQDLETIASWPEIVESLWVDHYSSYNKRRSWHAVALRSFGGTPDFIEKPAEMSKNWKQENPETLAWPIADTPLFDLLPGARDLLAQTPANFERVRLMRLTKGGELSRHADITDKDAGTADGQIMRLHLPIRTHPSVQFTSWNLNNEEQTVHMTPGRWWYLDVRKPHRAQNMANFDRVHLVADAVANPILREAISHTQ